MEKLAEYNDSMNTSIPLARREIENAAKLHETIKIIVISNEYQNLPSQYPKGATVPIDLYGNRPLNLRYSEEYLFVDLCFKSLPRQYKFKWSDILAVVIETENETIIKHCLMPEVSIIMINEDNWLTLKKIDEDNPRLELRIPREELKSEEEIEAKMKSHLTLVK